MRLLFVHPSKQFAGGGAYDYALTPAPAAMRLPASARMWGADLARTLAARGHRVTYATLETPAYMAARFGAETMTVGDDGGLEFLCASSLDAVRARCAAADGFVLRHDYPCYPDLFDPVGLGDRPVVQILCGTHPLRFRLDHRRLVLLANSPAEVALHRRRGIDAHLFVKPARALFYAAGPPPAKRHDVLAAMWNTGVPRKRFDLLLDALPPLDRAAAGPLHVAVAGRSDAHAARIAALNGSLSRLRITALGELRPQALAAAYRAARLTVVTSREDANPQVITESLASDIPVACAADITGGAHQITAACGALFEPTPEHLAATILAILAHPERFAPARHAPTLAASADQLEALLAPSPD